MRWNAFFFLKDNKSNETAKETFGFKPKRNLAQTTEMQFFEKELLDMIKSLKFRNVQDDFQSKMESDISKSDHPQMCLCLRTRQQTCMKYHLMITKDYYMKTSQKHTKGLQTSGKCYKHGGKTYRRKH